MVKQDFPRRIDGYNRPFIINYGANIAPGASSSCSAPAGPGRVERIQITADTSLPYQIAYDMIAIVIDGNTIIDTYMNSIWRWNAALSPFPTYAYNTDGTATVIFDAIVCLDYESSCIITLKNIVAGPTVWHVLTLVGRVGR